MVSNSILSFFAPFYYFLSEKMLFKKIMKEFLSYKSNIKMGNDPIH